MKCPKCGSDMAWKQHPEAAVGVGKPKGPEAGRDWHCKKCHKFINELEDSSQ